MSTTKRNRTKRSAAKPTLAQKAERLIALKEEAAAKYREVENLMDELLLEVKVGEEISLPNGNVFTIVDPFVDAAGRPCKLWRRVPVSRFDYKVTSGRL